MTFRLLVWLSIVLCAQLQSSFAEDWNLERWVNISGTSLSSLEYNQDYPDNPLLSESMSGELASPSTNWGSNYGSRVRTLVTPQVSGDYYFWVSGDDDIRLLLSSDATPDNLSTIASIRGYTAVAEWDKYDTQRSEAVTLTAGQSYYLELLHKEGGGGDHFAVAWARTPTGIPTILPASVLSAVEAVPVQAGLVISAGVDQTIFAPRKTVELHGQATHVENGQRNLTVSWTQISGPAATLLTPDAHTTEVELTGVGTYVFEYSASQTGETASDRVTIVHEASLHPSAGSATQAFWFDIGSGGLSVLENAFAFPQTPDAVREVTELSSPRWVADRFGSRTSGYILAPETGRYRFFLAADEFASFRLSEAGSAENLVEHASVTSVVSEGDFSAQASQISGWITLTRGVPARFELLHKDEFSLDYFELLWQREGESWAKPLSGEFLAPISGEYSGSTVVDFSDDYIVIAGHDRTIYSPDLSVSLDAYLRKRRGGNHTAELWSSSSPDVFFETPNDDKTVVSFPGTGVYELMFTVTTPAASFSDSLTVTVEPPLAAGVGGMTREVWFGGFESIDDLRNDSRFPSRPDITDKVPDLAGPRNWSSNYGSRISGQIRVPQSGNYRFYVSADDEAEFWLSSDSSPANVSKLCELPSAVRVNEWRRNPSQVSALIPLQAGRTYYAELLHRERYGGDHCEVAWTFNDSADPQLITSGFLEPIGNPVDFDSSLRYFAHAGEDRIYYWPHSESHLKGRSIRVAGDQVVPDVLWTQVSGPDAVIAHPDSLETAVAFPEPGRYTFKLAVTVDGATHEDEMEIDVRAPQAADMGALTRSVWLDIFTDSIAAFRAIDADFSNPTFEDLIKKAEIPKDFTELYGTRLSGYLQVPVSGNYQFSIAADDLSELSLSTDSSPQNLRKIAEATRATGFRRWNRFASQTSAVIALEANTRYYLEALQTERSGSDYFSIALDGPATNGLELLSPGFIAPAKSARAHDENLELVLGHDRTLLWPSNTLGLAALAYDLDEGPNALSYQWSSTSEGVSIAAPTNPFSDFTFAAPGLYELQMTISDGVNSRSGSVMITVQDPLNTATGSITRELWMNLRGGRVEELTSNEAFPDNPDLRDTLPSFDAGMNIADEYGQRLYGLLSVPSTGDYEFFIASDDEGELWLNPSGESAEGKTLIAKSPFAVGRYIWQRVEEQKSAPIRLVAGQSYYIEALQKERGGGDYVSVAYRPFGSEENPRVIPGAMLAPLNAEGISSDDDLHVEAGPSHQLHWPFDHLTLLGHALDREPGPVVLTYQWSVTRARGPHSAGEVVFDHPDRLQTEVRFPGPGKYTIQLSATDGASVVTDSLSVSIASPLADDAGSILVDAFYGVNGNRAENLEEAIASGPNERFQIQRLDAGPSNRDNFGWRIRGYLLPPMSGVYRFNITGDDWVEAHLSTDDEPENKQLLCLSTMANARYDWDRYPDYQLSRPVVLKKGKRYYIELLFKESYGRDHFSLAWLCPRHENYEIIESAYIAPFVAGDGIAPTILLTGDENISLTVGEDYTEPGFVARASDGSDLTGQVRVEGEVDSSTAGTYQLRYYVTDEDGAEALVANRSVTVSLASHVAPTYLPDAGTTSPPQTWTEPDGVISDFEASRFLIQASFGPTDESIEDVKRLGYEGWIDQQLALPPTLHLEELDHFARFMGAKTGLVEQTRNTGSLFEIMPDDGMRRARVSHDDRINTWWTCAIDGEDQLRQRVAFALSEIVVISDYNPVLERYPRGVTNYYDILVNGAFGNYRDLLEDVTLSPMMGFFLTMLRSDKEIPDENYGREVMQLFTVGLEELNLDGSKKLDAGGNRQSTYSQSDVSEISRALTGWTFNNSTNFYFTNGAVDSMNPMMAFPEHHDMGAKTIIGGAVIPAGQTAEKDLSDCLDVLFNHPNVAPFLARRLIQRLVTSNPSPEYIYRVSKAFEDDGTGTRGNLGAVVKAVLLDPEARNATALNPIRSGQLREPIIRATHLIRAFRKEPSSNPPTLGRFPLKNPYFQIREAPLWALSVFNFFEPNYQVPGPLMDAGLYSPEFQIANEVSVVDGANYFFNGIRSGFPKDYGQSRNQRIDLSSLDLEVVGIEAILERVERLLVGAPLSQESRAAFTALAAEYARSSDEDEFASALLQILMAVPEFTVLH